MRFGSRRKPCYTFWFFWEIFQCFLFHCLSGFGRKSFHELANFHANIPRLSLSGRDLHACILSDAAQFGEIHPCNMENFHELTNFYCSGWLPILQVSARIVENFRHTFLPIACNQNVVMVTIQFTDFLPLSDRFLICKVGQQIVQFRTTEYGKSSSSWSTCNIDDRVSLLESGKRRKLLLWIVDISQALDLVYMLLNPEFAVYKWWLLSPDIRWDLLSS